MTTALLTRPFFPSPLTQPASTLSKSAPPLTPPSTPLTLDTQSGPSPKEETPASRSSPKGEVPPSAAAEGATPPTPSPAISLDISPLSPASCGGDVASARPSGSSSEESNSPPLFSPDPRDIHSLIELLGSIDHTLREIAESHNTTVEALTLWMQSTEISRRLDAIESATTRRTRLVANNYLACAVESLAECIASATHEEKHVPVQTSSLAALEQRRRSRETLRKCVALLQRLAKHTPVGRPSGPTSPPPSRPFNNNKPTAKPLVE